MDKPNLFDIDFTYFAQAGISPQEIVDNPKLVLTIRDAAMEMEDDGMHSWLAVPCHETDPFSERTVLDALWMFPCRTTPTRNELRKNSAAGKGGVFIMAPGVINRKCLQLGTHMRGTKSARPAMVQAGTILGHRDGDGDSTLDEWRGTGTYTNGSGVNIHSDRGSSAGCTLMREEDMPLFLALVAHRNRALGTKLWDWLCLEPLLESKA